MGLDKEVLAELVACKYYFYNHIVDYISNNRIPNKDDFKAWYEEAQKQFTKLKQEQILQALDNALLAFIVNKRVRENAMQREPNAT